MRLDPTPGETERGPRPLKAYGLHEEVAPQLAALTIDPARPVLAVDVDEVLVLFARHLQRFMLAEGYRLDLSEYQIDGAITRVSDGSVLTRPEGWALIGAYFDRETLVQEAVDGAAEALRGLAEDPAVRAQVIVLTNVPMAARADRIANLKAQGIDYPLVANIGGKGRALRYLWDHSAGPMAFVDDSGHQLGSCARRAPDVARVHFVADEDLRRVAGTIEEATHAMESWATGRALLARILGG